VIVTYPLSQQKLNEDYNEATVWSVLSVLSSW